MWTHNTPTMVKATSALPTSHTDSCSPSILPQKHFIYLSKKTYPDSDELLLSLTLSPHKASSREHPAQPCLAEPSWLPGFTQQQDLSSFGSLKELRSPTAPLAVTHSSPCSLPSQTPFQFCWTKGRGKVRQPTGLLGYCRGHKPTRIKAGYICQVIETISCPAQFSGPWHIPLCFIYRSWVELRAIHSGHWDSAALQVTCGLVWSYTCKDHLV